jgi:transposase, IS5 family
MIERKVAMQRSFSDLEYATKKKVTRRDRFLGEINAVTPWFGLVEEVEQFYPKDGGRGRPRIGLERMPHVRLLTNLVFFREWGFLLD